MAIDGKELARRLRAAREAAGVTQEAAAVAAGVSRPAMVQLEAGRRAVSGIELDRLAALYGRDVRFLLDGDASPVAHWRIDGLADMPGVADALDEAIRIGREMDRLEQITGTERPAAVRYEVGPPGSVNPAIAQGVRAADAERRRMGLGDGPVDDIVDLLETNGVRTTLLDMPDAISGLMVVDARAGPLVAVNRTHHVLRRTFSFAHEYGHVVMDAGTAGGLSRGGESRTNPYEVRANAFAAALLMPEVGIRRHLSELGKGGRALLPHETFGDDPAPPEARQAGTPEIRVHDLAILAHTFGVTRVAMSNRLRSLRILTERQVAKLRAADARSGRAVAALLGLREPAHGWERDRFQRRFARLVLEAYGRGGIDRAKVEAYLTGDAGLDPAQVAEVIGAD